MADLIAVFAQVRSERSSTAITLTRKLEVPPSTTAAELRALLTSRLSDLDYLARGFTVEVFDTHHQQEHAVWAWVGGRGRRVPRSAPRIGT